MNTEEQQNLIGFEEGHTAEIEIQLKEARKQKKEAKKAYKNTVRPRRTNLRMAVVSLGAIALIAGAVLGGMYVFQNMEDSSDSGAATLSLTPEELTE